MRVHISKLEEGVEERHVLLDELTGKVTHLAISTASMETAAHALRSQIQARENEIKQQEQRRRELDFLLAAFVSEAASAVR
ncbi:hypothetical protein H632_c254p2 [Helicosporidium sp. ATCC 50920]|nr:hypothetical protein H632_c254p2 [Helicosporidium sp. ATCC 50920]|eukprot:KDD76361.1 hypothetical protein H632_c254p2 [Helicosporidium sp. ATCC 50920]